MISGNLLRSAVISGANNISNNRKMVDELNVFPVPDGDTGTNMTLSISNVAKELAVKKDLPVGDTAKVVSSALLRGARGNSGVILSLIFRGFSKGLKGLDEAGAEDIANALDMGTKAAYKAVMKPTEGTILTVSKEAAKAAADSVANGETDPVKVFAAAVEGAKVALAQTPEILPVLKKAGVVDAGGQGLVVIFEGMLSVFEGKGEVDATETDSAKSSDNENTYEYAVSVKTNRNDKERDPIGLRSLLETIGTDITVEDSKEEIKVKVNTNRPDKVLRESLKYGSLIEVSVVNIFAANKQKKENENIENTVNSDDKGDYTPVVPENDYGFVAVAAGEGLKSLFVDLGVDSVVSGGQTMNPSTEDILRAVELTPAKTVFVLPNNKNIIMASEQAARLATRNVIVLQTKTVPMGISAMLAFDPETSADENAENMQTAADKVSTGSITFAARDSDYEGFKIHEGEILALANGKLSFVDNDIDHAALKLVKTLQTKDSCFVSVIYGEDISDGSAEAVKAQIEAKYPNLEVTLIPGGQPVYYYIISVE